MINQKVFNLRKLFYCCLRNCFNCGSDKTYVTKDGLYHWYNHNNEWYCEKCNNILFKNSFWRARQLKFRDKYIRVDKIVRTGQCQKCGNNIHDGTCLRTSIHHLEYHENDPMEDTIELCNSCHYYETKENTEYLK